MIDWSFLADPSYKPPEGLLDLNLKVDFQGLLEQFDSEVLVRFAVNEARLVLPVFEAECPGDDNPRRAIEAAEHYLLSPDFEASYAAARAAAGVDTARAAAGVDTSRTAASRTVAVASAAASAAAASSATVTISRIESVACWALQADPSISIENQIKRLLEVKRK